MAKASALQRCSGGSRTTPRQRYGSCRVCGLPVSVARTRGSTSIRTSTKPETMPAGCGDRAGSAGRAHSPPLRQVRTGTAAASPRTHRFRSRYLVSPLMRYRRRGADSTSRLNPGPATPKKRYDPGVWSADLSDRTANLPACAPDGRIDPGTRGGFGRAAQPMTPSRHHHPEWRCDTLLRRILFRHTRSRC